jgi:hypothetical protein
MLGYGSMRVFPVDGEERFAHDRRRRKEERQRSSMRFRALIMAGVAAALGSAGGANAATRTYDYAVTHSRYGAIGTYDRVFTESGGVTQANSHLRIAVKVLGLVVHREDADTTETWRGGRLTSFDSTTTVNGKPIKVTGEARGGQFVVNTPTGVETAPPDVAPTDPSGFARTGRAEVVSLKSGRLDKVDVTGGEMQSVALRGASVDARHYRVSTAAQPNKWEVWLDSNGLPVKFRSQEHGDFVDFVLTNPPAKPSTSTLAMERTGDDVR